MSLESLKTVVEIGYYIGAIVAAIAAVIVYYRNSRLEQSRWASSFYDKSYESDRYKKVRDALDPGDQKEILELVGRKRQSLPTISTSLSMLLFSPNRNN